MMRNAADADHAGDDADAPAGLFEPRPLLDMSLEISEMPRRIEPVGTGDLLAVRRARARSRTSPLLAAAISGSVTLLQKDRLPRNAR